MSRHAVPAPVSPSRSSSSLSSAYLSSASGSAPNQFTRTSGDSAASSLQQASDGNNAYSSPPPRAFAPPPAHPSMGQASSYEPLASPISPDRFSAAKFKRAFGRRKKSDDSVTLFGQMQQKFATKTKERERTPSVASLHTPDDASLVVSAAVQSQAPPLPARAGKAAAKQLGLQVASSAKQVFSGMKPHNVVNLVTPGGGRPPPPPKPATLHAAKRVSGRDQIQPSSTPAVAFVEPSNESLDEPGTASDAAKRSRHSSIMPVSPSMDPALQFMRCSDDVEKAEAKEHTKAEWRKSDATTINHATARPGTVAGTRTSRPVSMAESVNSTATVMPANRRMSALITDSDFAMLEVDEEPTRVEGRVPRSAPVQDAPSGIFAKALNRRSQSLSLGSSWGAKLKAAAFESSSTSELGTAASTPSRETAPGVLAPSMDSPAVSMTAATGFIAPSNMGGPATTSGNIRGRLAAWTTAAGTSNGPLWRKNAKSPGSPPPVHPGRLSPMLSRETPNATRQPAISITSQFSPAAGFAAALGRKVGRAWGDRSSSPSSASPSSAPSSYPGTSEDPLGRVHSNGSGTKLAAGLAHLGKGKGRRTPNAPSGAWSVASSATSSSVSDSDYSSLTPTGPLLGQPLRAPLRTPDNGSLVFGRALAACVQATRAVSIGDRRAQKMPENLDFEVLGPQVFDHRLLPALVQRCAEHIIKWGVGGEEEGLFRISGRSTHVSRLRAEFDQGADYDLAECTPADLDPHAVASVLKAYLRELPEPILTHELSAYFEAALAADAVADGSPEQRSARGRGQGLPAGPRSGGHMPLRKPPSLSTLAAPSFAGMRAPSKNLLDALAVLVARLPQENRDLLRTVTDVMRETAKKSKTTKMPLSNLLLVFCPSLHMNPTLVRVFCEAEIIWAGAPKGVPDPVVVDIKSEPVFLDIKPDELSAVIDISPKSSGKQLLAEEDTSNRISREPTSASDDNASALSASDASFPSSSSTRPGLSLHGLTTSSSSESLGPSTPSESPVPFAFAAGGDALKATKPVPPRVASPSEGIAFPMTALAPSPISPRKSFPSLSLPSPLITTSDGAPRTPPSPGPSPRAVRMKRPSLTLLFSGKRSPSPLASGLASISSPQLIASSNPLVPTPGAHPADLAAAQMVPRLTTPISSSPIDFSGSFAAGAPLHDARGRLAVPGSTPAGNSSSGSLVAPGEYFRTPSSSTGDSGGSYSSALTSTSDAHAVPRRSPRTSRSPASASTLDFEVGDSREAPEEWTRSVLIAADVEPEPDSDVPVVSVRDVIQAFEQSAR